MQEKTAAVPGRFCREPFYKQGNSIAVTIQPDEIGIVNAAKYFYEDIIHYSVGQSSHSTPWKNAEKATAAILKMWETEGQPFLITCYDDRNRRKARPLMIYFTSRLIQALFWAGGNPVPGIMDKDLLKLKWMPYAPVNIADRLSFILASVDHHHAFTVLDQLFEEAKKKWAVYYLK